MQCPAWIKPITNSKNYQKREIRHDQTYEVLSRAGSAIVVSGTASLEACVLKVPQVVLYKTGMINYILARLMIR